MMACAYLVILVLIARVHPSPPFASGWDFREESVTVELSEYDFTVTGEYQFTLSGNASAMVIKYPFPKDDALGRPELLRAEISGTTGWRQLTVHEEAGSWRWLADPEGATWVTIRIMYRQGTSSGSARYVLTSTSAWGKPIGRARLEVRVPSRGRYRIVPELQFEGVDGKMSLFGNTYEKFLPTTDLKVERLKASERW